MLFFAIFASFIGYAAIFDLIVYGVCCLFGWTFNVWVVTCAGLIMSFITCLFLSLMSVEEYPYEEETPDGEETAEETK